MIYNLKNNKIYRLKGDLIDDVGTDEFKNLCEKNLLIRYHTIKEFYKKYALFLRDKYSRD